MFISNRLDPSKIYYFTSSFAVMPFFLPIVGIFLLIRQFASELSNGKKRTARQYRR
ncbi:MAG: hypothetical protein VZR27_03900 [Acutalibacteraceae bacterium]|nr:hypothetical protein [Acutalibacteraceae bacterium]